jgi:hypothetical protein
MFAPRPRSEARPALGLRAPREARGLFGLALAPSLALALALAGGCDGEERRRASSRAPAAPADGEGAQPATADAPHPHDPASDDPASDDPASDDPASDDPASDEPASDDPASDDPASDDPASDVPAPGELGGCTLSAPRRWLEGAPPRGTLALRLAGDAGEAAGLLAVAHGGAVRTVRVGDDGPAGSSHPFDLEGAAALFALERVGGGHVLLARGACPESAHCLLARRLDARGAPSGATVAAALPAPLRTARRAAAGARLYLAWSTEGGHRALDLFTVAGDGLGRARRTLGDEPPSEELPTEILGLAAAEGPAGWAVVWRRGAPEDARSRVYLTTERTNVALEALHEVLVIDALAFDGRALALVAGFEFSRPHFLRLAPGAAAPTEARALAAGEPLPPPFEDHVRAALELDGEGLWLRRSDAAGDPVGAPLRVAPPGVGAATVARAGEGFAVAWIDPATETVRARRVRCAEPSALPEAR